MDQAEGCNFLAASATRASALDSFTDASDDILLQNKKVAARTPSEMQTAGHVDRRETAGTAPVQQTSSSSFKEITTTTPQQFHAGTFYIGNLALSQK